MTRELLPLVFIISTALVSCESPSQEQLSSFESTITQLREQVGELEKQYGELQKELETQKITQQFLDHQYATASFDPAADQGFVRLDTELGPFAVSLEDVRPFADGLRVRLHVGNLTSATIVGASLKAKWGPRLPQNATADFTHYEAWHSSLKEQEVRISKNLEPGRWNNVTLALPGTKPEDFGHLELSMETEQISLFREK
jgi:Protein of unknown function (DUF3251)